MLSRAARTVVNVNISLIAALPLGILFIGCGVVIHTYWSQWLVHRRAAAAGAVLPPTTPHKLPFGYDIVQKMKVSSNNSYIASLIADFCHHFNGYTFNFRLMGTNRIFTAEPEHIKMILATDFSGYEKGSEFHFQMESLLGTGVFNSDGEMWKFHRAMTRPFFSKDRISHFDIFDRHADDALTQAKTRIGQGLPVDWQDLVSRFTLDSATEFLFGKDVRSLSAGLPYPPNTPEAQHDNSASNPANQFSSAFLEAQLACANRGRLAGQWPLFEFFQDKVDKHTKVIDAFIDPILNAALDKKKSKSSTNSSKDKNEAVGEDETLLEHLVNLTDDPVILKDETLNILLAGRDTTAATLTFAVYRLTQHPDIVRRLREEILSKVGSSRRPTYDDIRDMKYLRAFINEVLRLYPPVPFNVRTSTRATTWPSQPGNIPWYIPQDTRCVYSVFVMHRRKDLWGPDALQFDPDRFLDERLHKYITPNPFIFLPFNAGPRICLGQQFAYNEASFMIIRLLQRFASFTLCTEANPESIPVAGWAESRISDGSDKLWFKAHLTMYAKGGMWLKMTEAQDA
ncbi:cytochrome P450 family protein [Abortiporus biennis]